MWIFYFSFFLSDVLLSYRLSLLHPSLIPSTDLPDHHSLLLLVMSICFISVCVSSSSSSSSLHTRFSSHLFFCSLLSSYLTRDYSTVQHHAPLLIPHSLFSPPPRFPFTDSQHSLPLSSALSPLYKDSHWWTWTFCTSHILTLILFSCTSCEEETN